MRQLLTFLFTSVFFLASQAQKVVNDPNAELRTVPAFHSISVSGPFEVIISQGSTHGLAVSAEEKSMNSEIRTEVENGVLKIWTDQKSKFWKKSRKLKAYISVKEIQSIKGSGASVISFDGSLSSPALKISLSGASDIRGRLNVANLLDVSLSGASDLTISGSAGSVKVDASGASKLRGYDFTAAEMDAEASGASSIQLTVEKELSASLSGASSLRYKGNAIIRNIKTSGASSIARAS